MKFVLKLFELFQSNLAIVMLAQEALKELVGSSLCKYNFDCHPIKMCIVQDKPPLFVDVLREFGWNKYLRSGWSSLQLLLAGQGLL